MKEKKICFFNTSARWGGGEKWHLDMAARLARRGMNICAAAGSSGPFRERIIEAGIPLHTMEISNLSFLNIVKIRRVAAFLTRENIDTLIVNLPSDLKVAGPAARIAGNCPLIYRRGSAIPLRDSFLNRYLFKNCVSSVIVNSEETRGTILANNPAIFDDARITTIYNGIDLEEWDTRPRRPLPLAEKEEIVLGTAGRLEIEKAHGRLIDLAVVLRERGLQFRLLIAGSGRLRKKLERQVARRGLSKEVTFTGFVEDMKSFMDSIDIFLLSSLWEGFGYVLIEAMASGKPVVAFDLASTREIVDDERSGFLVPAGDIGAMAAAVEKLSGDAALREETGKKGRSAVEKRFGIEEAVDRLLTVINS
ncbi:MAG: glycosyltransferase [Candidatus Krumholzibacteriota bacterium]|nr:glycosyltransferase [Candidatus Krumholzibacteriota bacterium]